MKMNLIDWIVFLLVMIGGLNWGLVGAFNFNLVTFIFGKIPILVNIIYIIIGLSVLWTIGRALLLKKK